MYTNQELNFLVADKKKLNSAGRGDYEVKATQLPFSELTER